MIQVQRAINAERSVPPARHDPLNGAGIASTDDTPCEVVPVKFRRGPGRAVCARSPGEGGERGSPPLCRGVDRGSSPRGTEGRQGGRPPGGIQMRSTLRVAGEVCLTAGVLVACSPPTSWGNRPAGGAGAESVRGAAQPGLAGKSWPAVQCCPGSRADGTGPDHPGYRPAVRLLAHPGVRGAMAVHHHPGHAARPAQRQPGSRARHAASRPARQLRGRRAPGHRGEPVLVAARPQGRRHGVRGHPLRHLRLRVLARPAWVAPTDLAVLNPVPGDPEWLRPAA